MMMMVMQPMAMVAPLPIQDVDLCARDAFVTFRIISGRDLFTPGGKLPNPFVKLSATQNAVKFKTATQDKTTSPTFGEEFKFNQLCNAGEYVLKVKSKGFLRDDFLGTVIVKKEHIAIGSKNTFDFELKARPGKADKVAGSLKIEIRARHKTAVEAINEVLAKIRAYNFLYVHLAPGTQPVLLLNLVQSIGVALGFRVQASSHVVGLATTETFYRDETHNESHFGDTYAVTTRTTYTEECLIQVVVQATSSGQMYAQISYNNVSGHESFFGHWQRVTQSIIQSALGGNMLNNDVRLKTIVGSQGPGAASTAGCVIQ
jgi:hypothetical protein